MTSALPVVAVVGRPNVGKSTLVNRIVGRREAIVEERPGVTRDRKVLAADWAGREFTLVDTGGWQTGGVELDRLVSAQAQRAIKEADAILFVVDVTVGQLKKMRPWPGCCCVPAPRSCWPSTRWTTALGRPKSGTSPASGSLSRGPSRHCTAGARVNCSTLWPWRSTRPALVPPPRRGHRRTGDR